MFTKADHAKAVELYKRFGTEEWWPPYIAYWDETWWATLTGGGIAMSDKHATSAIAWAMEDALGSKGDFNVGNTESGEWVVTLQTNYGRPPMETRNASRFLAIAAAMEAQ